MMAFAPGCGSSGAVLSQAALLAALLDVGDGGQVHVRLPLPNANVHLPPSHSANLAHHSAHGLSDHQVHHRAEGLIHHQVHHSADGLRDDHSLQISQRRNMHMHWKQFFMQSVER